MNIFKDIELSLRHCAMTAAQAQLDAMRTALDDALDSYDVAPFSVAAADLRAIAVPAYLDICNVDRARAMYTERVPAYRRHLARAQDVDPGTPPPMPTFKTLEECTPALHPLPDQHLREHWRRANRVKEEQDRLRRNANLRVVDSPEQLLERRACALEYQNSQAPIIGAQRYAEEMKKKQKWHDRNSYWHQRLENDAYDVCLAAFLGIETAYASHVLGDRGPWQDDRYIEWSPTSDQAKQAALGGYKRGAAEAASLIPAPKLDVVSQALLTEHIDALKMASGSHRLERPVRLAHSLLPLASYVGDYRAFVWEEFSRSDDTNALRKNMLLVANASFYLGCLADSRNMPAFAYRLFEGAFATMQATRSKAFNINSPQPTFLAAVLSDYWLGGPIKAEDSFLRAGELVGSYLKLQNCAKTSEGVHDDSWDEDKTNGYLGSLGLSARGSVGQSQEEDAFNWQRVADLLDSDDIASFDASWSLDHSYVFVPAYDARTMEARSQRKLMQHPKVIDCDLQRIFGDIWPTRLSQTSKPLSLMNQVRAENQMGQDRPEKRLRLRVLLEMTHLWLRRSGIRDASDTAAAQAVALDAFDALGGAFGPPDLQSAQ